MKWINCVCIFILSWCLSGGVIHALDYNAPLGDSTGLLLVDIQNFYFPGGQVPLQGAEAAAKQAGQILKWFRENGWPVFHVRHLSKKLAASPDKLDREWEIHEMVTPLHGERVIVKHYVSSFRGTRLDEMLKSAGIQHLVVCGMQTHMCLEAAVRAAADLGYRVTVVGDACATRDLEFEGTLVPARLVHASTLATLKSGYANLITTEAMLKQKIQTEASKLK